jgi:phosphoglycolate phosphatase
MKKYEIILFDLDGTITDPQVGITKSILYALSKMGIEEKNPARLVEFIGPPLPESFNKFYGLDEVAARVAVSFYREYYTESGIYEAILYPGVTDLLKVLCENNRRLILATSKATIYAERVAKHFDFDRYFCMIAGSNFDLTMLQKHEIVEYALRNIGDYHKDGTVMVGDRSDDIDAARLNGIDSIAVTYGYGSREELKKCNPIYTINSVEDLIRLLL